MDLDTPLYWSLGLDIYELQNSKEELRKFSWQSRLCPSCDRGPDTEVFYRHDTFWQPRTTQSDLREQVGVRMNMPIYQKRLSAAVCEAIQQLTKSQAEYDQLLLDIQREVQASYERVLESQQSIELYSKKLIPTAEKNVSVVRANYDNSKSTFVELAIAQRQVIDFKEKLIQAQVELQRRLTSLRRVVGGALQ